MAIKKEMKKIFEMGAFEKFKGGTPDQVRRQETPLPGFKEIGCHMIFDIEMDGSFTRKARFVANGNETDELPKLDSCASVVSRETVRIALLCAALNGLDVLSCDITDACLNAPCTEKLWTEAGAEFGSDKGSVVIMRKAVHGSKHAGQSWRQTLAQTLDQMGHFPSRADPDLCLRLAKDESGEELWEWTLACLC